MRNKHFLIVIYHSSLVKAAVNAAHVCKLCNGVKKTPQFLLFSTVKGGMNILRSYLNFCTNVNWKPRNRTNPYRYCPARWIRPEVGSFHRTLLKETSRQVFRKIRPPHIKWEPFQARAPSRTVIAHYALNEQMRSKAHTALTASLVLHHTRIYKRAMKKIIFNGQRRNKHFFIVIYHSSLVKGAMNAARLCKLRNGC